MRRQFHWAFMAMLFAACAWALTVNWNGSAQGLGISTAAAQGPALTPPPPVPADGNANAPAAPGGAEVLSQGPVHEAFAAPLELNAKPGPVVNKRPPDPIKEIPPSEQPDGENIVWIPGYWSWDDDRQDFIWISGVWRATPPYQTWVPGYWSQVDGGFQWTPGLWTATAKQEVSYLPQPPQSLENGPSSPQPSEDQFWIPGSWVYQNVNYQWRPGYWTACRPDWIWVPAHYAWTPAGYVFVDGFWDYELPRRGCLFAPVYFAQPVYAQPAFAFTPGVVFNVGLFSNSLFVRPAFGAYYFGDYFGPQYATLGFSPWFSITIGNRPHFDPLFTYYRWHNAKTDPNWLAHTQQHFDMLRKDEALRPPHTFAAQQELLKNNPGARAGNAALVMPLREVAKNPSSDFKFHSVSLSDRQALADKGSELQQSAQQRSDFERKATANGLSAGGGGAVTSRDSNFKLPTAAASKMTLPGGTQAGTTSTGNPQGNNLSTGNRFGNNASAAGNGYAQRLDSGNKMSTTLPNQGNENNSNNVGTQTQTHINRPSLIQPGGGLPSGNASSGNGGGYQQNLGNGTNSGQQTFGNQNQNAPRSQLYPGAGGATGGIAPNNNPAGNSGNGAGRNGAGGSGNGNNNGNKDGNKDDPNKKNKNTNFTPPRPPAGYQPAKSSLIDTPEILRGAKKDKSGSAHDESQQLASENSDDQDSANSSKSSDVKKAAASDTFHLPPLFRSNAADTFRNPFLPGGGDAATTPDSDASGTANDGSRDNASSSGVNKSDNSPTAPGNSLGGNGAGGYKSSGATMPLRPGTAGSMPNPFAGKAPALTKFDYQTLAERGRTQSTRNSYTGTSPSTASPYGTSPDEQPLPGEAKGPTSSIGLGSQNHTMYGPMGASSSGPLGPLPTTGLSTMPSGPLGLGSSSGSGSDFSHASGSYIPTNTLPSMQHFDLHLPKAATKTAPPDASERSYDPARGY